MLLSPTSKRILYRAFLGGMILVLCAGCSPYQQKTTASTRSNDHCLLLKALQEQDDNKASLLLKQGYSPNEHYTEEISEYDSDHSGLEITHGTALMIACANGNLKMVRELLSYGANPNHVDNIGVSALIYVCGSTSVEQVPSIILELLKHGANIDHADQQGWTPLIEAARSGTEECVKLLLGKGAKVDFQDNMGRTALMFASNRWAPRIMQSLLQAGASPKKRDYQKHTAIDYIQMDVIDYSMAWRPTDMTQAELLKVLKQADTR